MSEVPEPRHQTVSAIYAWHEAQNVESPRPYLGASSIGHHCARYLWLSFRWSKPASFSGRMLRLFETGHLAEPRFVRELRGIGCEVHEVDPATGKQFAVEALGGHFRGHLDGCAVGIPEAKKTWHVLEFKTHGEKSFKELSEKGVKDSKPQHYAQMQVYMALTGMERALYLAVNKNTDELYSERIAHVPEESKALLERAESIIFSAEPPPRISDDASWYQCKMCDMHGICHGTETPAPQCRNCAHVTPERDGSWSCEHHTLHFMTAEQQSKGCKDHRYIPILLANWATCTGGSEKGNAAHYTNTLTGNHFANAEGSASDYSSAEIHAAADKRAIGNPSINALRTAFGAELLA